MPWGALNILEMRRLQKKPPSGRNAIWVKYFVLFTVYSKCNGMQSNEFVMEVCMLQ